MLMMNTVLTHFFDPIFNVDHSWDVAASIIALLSICIAIASFIIALKTLKSQIQTAKNTMPVITQEIQEVLLERMFRKIFDNYIALNALKQIVNQTNYLSYPSEDILRGLKIDDTYIHMELYYNTPSNYKVIHNLLYSIKSYNIKLDVFNEHLKENHISVDYYRKEMERVLKLNKIIAKGWSNVMESLYRYDNNKKWGNFMTILKQIIKSQEKNINQDQFKIYYSEDDFFANLIDIGQKEIILNCMNAYANLTMQGMTDRFIPKNKKATRR